MWIDQSFSILALLIFEARSFFLMEDKAVHCRMFSSILGLYSSDASSAPAQKLWTKYVSAIAKYPLGGEVEITSDWQLLI